MNAVVPNDWTAFFRDRIWKVAPRAPMAGIENGGWKLVYTDVEPELTKAAEETSKLYDYWYSLGIMIQGDGSSGDADDGIVRDVVRECRPPRRESGRGCAWSRSTGTATPRRASATRSAPESPRTDPLELLLENLDTFKTYKVDYHGGEKFPHLERVAGKPDLVSAIGQAKAGATPAKK